MPPVEPGAILPLAQALARVPAATGEPFAELLRHGTMSVEIFAPVGLDTQQPHAQDELYVVIRGESEFLLAGERRRVCAGDLVFVRAGVEHRFENFTEGFAVWVVFYGPQGGEAATRRTDP